MSDLQQLMQSPEKFGELEFPLLEMPEIAELCSDIKKIRKQEMEDLILKSQVLTQQEKIRMVLSVKDPSIWDFAEWVDTPLGADAVLLRSLKKAGKNDADAKDGLKKIPPFRRVQVAQVVATTYTRPETNPT